MICKNCGQQNDNDALFCTKCGAKQETEGLSEELKDVLIEVVPEDSTPSEEGEQKGLEAECSENEDEPILEQETHDEEVEVPKEQETHDEEVEEPKEQEIHNEEVEEPKEQETHNEEVEEPKEQETLEEEILSHYPSDIFSNEFEYTKKIFNRYYKAEFNARSLGAYIALQIVTLIPFVFPGILFAIIYWAISNPITKSSLWKEMLYDNKGNLPIYKFFFKEEELVVRRNRTEECTMQYSQFKKIIMNKKGVLFLSKQRDFYLPIEEVKNVEELKEILKKFKNCKVK